MARIRFTKQALDELSTTQLRAWVYDEQVPLLALMVTAKGTKSFYVIKTQGGVKRHVRIGGYHEITIPQARQLASDLLLQVVKGEAVGAVRRRKEKADQFSLQAAYEEYRGYLQHHRKPNTIHQYDLQWARYLEAWASRPMKSIRRRDVVELHQAIGEGNGQHQANRVVALLRAIINRAIREHEMDVPNPANGITFYRETKRSRRLMPDELPAFFRAVEEEPNRDIRDFVLVSLFTGARKSNVLAMRWEDVSLDRGEWTIPKSDSKTSQELQVVLPDYVVEILRARQATTEGRHVFPARRYAEHMVTPERGWARICERAGLKNLHLHDLRRSLASFQIDTGTPLEVIQKTLGHESKMTTEIYARLAMDPVRASVERAGEEIRQRAFNGNQSANSEGN
jgi:integrase